MKHVIFTTLFALLSIVTSAQRDTIFYDTDWNVTPTKATANYYRIIATKKGNTYKIKDFFLDGTLQMIGTSKSDIEDIWEGPTIWFSEKGDTLEYTTYKNGIIKGLVKEYYEYDGTLYATGQIKNNQKFGNWIVYGGLRDTIQYTYTMDANGLQDTFNYYGYHGELLVEMKWKDNKLLKHTQVHPWKMDDTISLKLNDSIGNKQEWLIFKNEKLYTKAYFERGIRDSIALVYHTDGKTIQKRMYYDLQCDANAATIKEIGNGSEEFTFPSIYINQSHQMLDTSYRIMAGGCLQGMYQEFYEDGATKIVGSFSENLPIDVWKFYDKKAKKTTFDFSKELLSQKEKLSITFKEVSKDKERLKPPEHPLTIFYEYESENVDFSDSEMHEYLVRYLNKQDVNKEEVAQISTYLYNTSATALPFTLKVFTANLELIFEKTKNLWYLKP